MTRWSIALVLASTMIFSQMGNSQSASANLANRLSVAPSRIIQSQHFGRGNLHFGHGGCITPPIVGHHSHHSHCDPHFVGVPVFGWGAYPAWGTSWSGYGVSYGDNSQGYYLDSIAQENQELRSRLDRLEREAWDNARAADDQQDVGNQAPAQRERVQRSRIESALRTGLRLFQKESYLHAADKFRLASRLDAKDAVALFYLMQSHFAAGQYAQASDAAKEAIARNPDWPAAKIDIRGMYADPKLHTAQLGSLAQHLKAHPMDADALFVLGVELFSAQEFDKARTIFEQAARIAADDGHLQPFLDYFAKVDDIEKPARARADVPPVPEPQFEE